MLSLTIKVQEKKGPYIFYFARFYWYVGNFIVYLAFNHYSLF